VLVLDTHAAVWWTLMPRRLSEVAREAVADAEEVGIPAIGFWEVSLLVRRGKLELDLSVAQWARTVCRIPRVRALALTRDIALRADTLQMHADPADRFIAATTLEHGASLLTKDKPLRALDWLPTTW
jgi:PIN domain nuclease of toxin-antitoxin system